MKQKSTVVVVIPELNEADRLPLFLEQIKGAIPSDSKHNFHFCVVDDGSNETQFRKIKEAVARLQPLFTDGHSLSLTRYEDNFGKGHAIREEFVNNHDRPEVEYLSFLDADGATDFIDFMRLVEKISSDPVIDACLGSRWKCLGIRIQRSFKRHLSGRIFATMVSNLFDIPIYDSQCGAKVFRKKSIPKEILAVCDDNRWLFDTQLVLTLYHLKKRILEIPVNWRDQSGSKVSLVKDSIRMFVGLFLFRRKMKALKLLR